MPRSSSRHLRCIESTAAVPMGVHRWTRLVTRRLLALSATVLLAGLMAATLVHMAPGSGVDERELDPRLSRESIETIRQAREAENDILRFYWRYLAGAIRGDFGVSLSFGRPVSELIADRLPVTLGTMATGLAAGWALAILFAFPAARFRSTGYELFSTFLSGLFLCIPSAVLALLLLWSGGAARIAVALVVFPRAFRYARNLLHEAYTMPHVVTAQAKGLGGIRILFWHILPGVLPQLAALAGVTVNVAFGASIPIEVVCDSPGIGQLAWQAALGRDLPLLVNVTLLVSLVTITANWAADIGAAAWTPQSP